MNITEYKTMLATTALCLILAFVSFGQATNEKLSLNQPLERQIKGGETHSFEFRVKTEFYARAEVEQQNIDVVVSLFDANSKLVIEMDGKNGGLWREAVSCVAEKDGMYRIEIKAYGATDQSESYSVKLAEIRESAANDRKRLEAEARLSAGRKFYEQGEAKRQEAIKEYEAAVALWRELGENYWEAVTLLNLGWTYNESSKNEESTIACLRATELFQRIKDRIGESKVAYALGRVHEDLKQYDKAKNYYQQSLIIGQETKDRTREGRSLNRIGIYYGRLADYQKAHTYFEQSLSVSREIKDRENEAWVLHNLGFNYTFSADYKKAIHYYEQSLGCVDVNQLNCSLNASKAH